MGFNFIVGGAKILPPIKMQIYSYGFFLISKEPDLSTLPKTKRKTQLIFQNAFLLIKQNIFS